MGKALVCALALGALLISGSAIAAPVTYDFTSGSVTITGVTSDTATTVIDSTVVAMDGDFITFDESTIDLTDLLLTIPTTGILSTVSAWGPYDQYRIESATISPSGSYSTAFGLMTGPGIYTFVATGLDIDGYYSAFDSTLTEPDLINQPFPFTDTSSISGTININTGTLTLTGITLASIPGVLFSEGEDLEIKADITFVGMEPIPEPGTALLVGLGILGLASSRRGKSLK